MNIAFDATAILGPLSKNRGIGNYALAQLKKMIEMDQDNDYYFFNLIEEYSMQKIVSSGNVKDFFFFTGKENELYVETEYQEIIGAIIKKFIKENNIDVFYVTSPFESKFQLYKREWFENIKVVVTVYDIIPYIFKERYLNDKNTYSFYMNCVENLRWMDEYLVISQSVKDDMIKYLDFPENKIHVIYGAVDESLYKKIDINEDERKALIEKYSIQGDFIMCTGGDDDRKNISGLITAFSKMEKSLLEQYQLVIVCKLSPQSVEKYTKLSHKLGIEGRVILTNYVSNEELIQLYNLATLMAFPSLYEGFGLPIVEAWRCGTPVLTSNNSSLGEIAGEGAICVNPKSQKSITEGLNEALGKNNDLQELLKKGQQRMELFTWDRVARDSIEVINNLKFHNEIEHTSVKKIAMFTPLPPIQSGIADYSVDIIRGLAQFYEIDLYIDDYVADDLDICNVQILPIKNFKKNYKIYDRIIYQVGNSLYHEYMFPYIKKYKGMIVLHDLNMKSVLETMYLYNSSRPNIFEQELRCDLNPDEVKDYMNNLNTVHLQKYEINGFVTNYASSIIVHSMYAKRKLLERNIEHNVRVIPLYTLVDDNIDTKKIKKQLGFNENSLVFAAFGHIHATKRVIPILHAIKRMKDELDNFQFIFVGKVAENLIEEFDRTIDEHGLKDLVKVTGFTTLEDFQLYMDAADICLNLRYPYNGESSAAFMRLLGKGKCTIVNRIGSFAEVPENASIMIENVENMSSLSEIEAIYNAMKMACDEKIRMQISENALKYAKKELAISLVIDKYREAIENDSESSVLDEQILKSCAKKLDGCELAEIAKTLAYVK